MINARILHFALLMLWLFVCIGLITADYWMPPGLRQKLGNELTLLVALCGLLAVWNLARLYASRPVRRPHDVSPEVAAIRRRIREQTGSDPRVVHPEFQFDDPATDSNEQPRTP